MLMRHLEYLDALARTRHFARAASACSVSQPGLSAGIRKLEADVGVHIVKRGRRFEGLTPEGERVLHMARRMLAERDALQQDLTSLKGQLSGTLRIGAIPTALTALTVLTEPFCVRHRHVQLSVYSLSSIEIVQQLSEFDLDVGITYVDGEPLGTVRTVPLYEEQYLLVTPVDTGFAERTSVGWAELADLPLCLLPTNMQNRRILQRNFADAGVTITPKLEADTVSVLYAHMSTLHWSSVIAGPWLKAFGVPEGMCAVPMVKPRRSYHVGLVLADREPPPLLARALLDVTSMLDMQAELDSTSTSIVS
jgi:DNA-binding transcriptional LysR family regulator